VAAFLVGIAPDIHVHVVGTLLDSSSRLNHEWFRPFGVSGRTELLLDWRENVDRLVAFVERWERCCAQVEHGNWSEEVHDRRRKAIGRRLGS
jgi:hypothetical protein